MRSASLFRACPPFVNTVYKPPMFPGFVCLFVFLIHCLLDVKDGLHVRYVADLGH